MTRRMKLLIAVPVALVALIAGGVWLYANVVAGDAPDRLTLTDTPGSTSSGAAPTNAAGSWTVTDESQAGYRVDEVLFGQNVTAVGRTNKVTGGITLAGTTVSRGEFTVDMASVRSDQSRRDNQYRGRIMETDRYPTSTFRLTQPIELRPLPADGATVTASATGDLTLRGTTKPVTFEVKARKSGDRMEINGSIPIVFADWGIPSPSFGPATVEDKGAIEFLLILRPGTT